MALGQRESPKRNKATLTTRSRRSVSQNVSYANMFQDSSSDDTPSNATVTKPLGAVTKREPSYYRLAAHRYMLASKRGIISGPKVRTRASTAPKQKVPTNKDTDSDATVILEDNIKPPVPRKRKTTGRNKKPRNKNKQKTFVTKTYILQKRRFRPQTKEKKEEEAILVQMFNVCIKMAYMQRAK